MSKWTPKGKPKDGCYFDGKCPRCGKQQVVIMGDKKRPVCSMCNNHEGVKITEKPKKLNSKGDSND